MARNANGWALHATRGPAPKNKRDWKRQRWENRRIKSWLRRCVTIITRHGRIEQYQGITVADWNYAVRVAPPIQP